MGEAARDLYRAGAEKLFHSLNTFIRHVLGVEPSAQQQKIINAIDTGERRIAVRSGHGVGKSALLAWILLWWISTRPDCKIPCTAPTAHQLKDILWSEVAHWHRRMVNPFRDALEITGEQIRHRSSLETWFAVARTARRENPEALQGFHAKHLAFLIDEASGIPEEVFEVAEGALSTPGALVVMVGNPTRREGTFFDAFHSDRAHWKLFNLSSLESPFVDADYPERMKKKYGEDSDVYRVRVLGEFPSSNPDGLISLDYVEGAINRDEPSNNDVEPLVYGVDVARFGDDETVLLKRRGRKVISITGRHGLDTMQTTGLVAADAKSERPAAIFVDVIGIGAGVADRLRELGYPVHMVNVAEKAADTERYDDLRTELWWRVRQWFEEGNCSIPNDEDLAAQLASITYKIKDSTGRLRIESKKDRKKKGLVSPDRGDALMLTFAAPVARIDDSNYHRFKGQLHQPFDNDLGF